MAFSKQPMVAPLSQMRQPETFLKVGTWVFVPSTFPFQKLEQFSDWGWSVKQPPLLLWPASLGEAMHRGEQLNPSEKKGESIHPLTSEIADNTVWRWQQPKGHLTALWLKYIIYKYIYKNIVNSYQSLTVSDPIFFCLNHSFMMLCKFVG